MIDSLKKAAMHWYYVVKPAIPRSIQISIRQKLVSATLKKYRTIWPIDENAAHVPKNWQGWPNNKKFAIILTHDVESQKGHDKCLELMELEKDLGFYSSFNFVPEKYNVSENVRNTLVKNGFEVGVHGLNHDGKLFRSKDTFLERAKKINFYLKEWNAEGFRAPAMHHNLDWLHELNIQYDLSTFDTDPFEPQSDGVSTIFPFFVRNQISGKEYLEMPYTLPQDFSTFILLKEKSIAIWQNKTNWIIGNKGMVLLNVHPDYISFDNETHDIEKYPIAYYYDFLSYIKYEYKNLYWNPLPKEVARYLKSD